jgi:sugar lactone lactonase YvrE
MKSAGRVAGALAVLSSLAWAQPYVISTIVGGAPATTSVPGLGLSFGDVWGIGSDAAGNTYMTSSTLNSVFRLDPGGQVIRIAGTSWPGYSGDSGPAINAQVNDPRGVTMDATGNLFIADYLNARIRKVSPDGVITTFAGTGTCCYSGDGGPATSAQFHTPFALASDSAGNVFVADIYGSRVRKISPAGTVTTLAGDGTYGFSGDGGPAAIAQLYAPAGVAADAVGNVFIADYVNRRIRKVSTDGTISTIAGGGNTSGDGGRATDARLIAPLGVAVDGGGNLFIADEFSGVRKVSPDGIITTTAGGGTAWSTAADGGPATSAAILPIGVAVDRSGNVSFIDTSANRIRRVSTDGIITTIAGNGENCCFSGDGGPAINAQLNDPAGVAVDGNGNLFIADSKNNRVRKVSPDGTIATVANACYYPDDILAACGLALDGAGNLYASEDDGTFKLSPDGSRTRLAGGAFGVVVDGAGNVFAADEYNHVVHRISPSGVTTTVAGTGVQGLSGDGGPAAAAQLSLPVGLALDSAGDLYIADSGNKRIRMVSASGVITTAADLSADLSVTLPNQPVGALIAGLAVDTDGNIYVEEASASFTGIRKISPGGTIETIAGTGIAGYSGDGRPALNAQLNPSTDELGNSLALDNAGNLYVADGGNRVVRVLRPVNH